MLCQDCESIMHGFNPHGLPINKCSICYSDYYFKCCIRSLVFCEYCILLILNHLCLQLTMPGEHRSRLIKLVSS